MHTIDRLAIKDMKMVLNDICTMFISSKLKLEYKSINVNPNNFEKKIIKYKNYICLNALHGSFGEDGEIQKILIRNKMSFTHSSYRSSRNSFDKYKSKTRGHHSNKDVVYI